MLPPAIINGCKRRIGATADTGLRMLWVLTW